MSRADDLARQREALRERAAEQRLAIVRTTATLRDRLSALRALVGAAGLLASTVRALWRRFGRRRGASREPAPDTGPASTPPAADTAPASSPTQ